MAFRNVVLRWYWLHCTELKSDDQIPWHSFSLNIGKRLEAWVMLWLTDSHVMKNNYAHYFCFHWSSRMIEVSHYTAPKSLISGVVDGLSNPWPCMGRATFTSTLVHRCAIYTKQKQTVITKEYILANGVRRGLMLRKLYNLNPSSLPPAWSDPYLRVTDSVWRFGR